MCIACSHYILLKNNFIMVFNFTSFVKKKKDMMKKPCKETLVDVLNLKIPLQVLSLKL